jgi:hypothetical protein
MKTEFHRAAELDGRPMHSARASVTHTRKAAHDDASHARKRPRRGSPQARQALMQKRPRANDNSTRSPTYYSWRVCLRKKDLVIYSLYHGQVPGRPCARRHDGTGMGPPHRATGNPPDTPSVGSMP